MPTATLKCRCCKERGRREDMILVPNGAAFLNADHAATYAQRNYRKNQHSIAKRAKGIEKAFQKRKAARTRADKDRIKTRREWMRDAQKAFNQFIRERDKWELCICCGGLESETWRTGGVWDCGHYLSVGAHPQHRFDEANAHKQLKACNAGSGKYTKKGYTVQQQYRERLIDKIGVAEVERLETDHEPKKYTIDDLRAIKAKYKQKLKDLKAGIQQQHSRLSGRAEDERAA